MTKSYNYKLNNSLTNDDVTHQNADQAKCIRYIKLQFFQIPED